MVLIEGIFLLKLENYSYLLKEKNCYG